MDTAGGTNWETLLFIDVQCWCEGKVAQKAAAKNRAATNEFNLQAMQNPHYQIAVTMMMAMPSPAIGEEAAEGVAVEGAVAEGAAAEGASVVERPLRQEVPHTIYSGGPQPAANGQMMFGRPGLLGQLRVP